MIFIIIVNYYSLMSYFPYVTCVRSHDRILLFRQCVLGFLVHYYSAISFHVGEGALECHLPIKFSENKRFRKKSEKHQLQLRYAPLTKTNFGTGLSITSAWVNTHILPNKSSR